MTSKREFRLNRLIYVLQNVPKRRFDLDSWSCGTTACACGWAAVDPVLMKEGFRLEANWYDDKADKDRSKKVKTQEEIIELNDREGAFNLRIEPAYKGETDWDAAEKFFKLTAEEAIWLFSPWKYQRTTRTSDVIKRIKKILKKYGHSSYIPVVEAVERDVEAEMLLGAQLLRQIIGEVAEHQEEMVRI